MNKFISRHKMLFVGIVAIFLVIAMGIASFFTKDGTSSFSKAMNFLFMPLHTTIANISDKIVSINDANTKYDSLRAEYDNLYSYVAKMEQDLRTAQEIDAENDRLRELLGLPLRERNFQYISCSVVDRTPSVWSRTLTLNKGTGTGVETGMCVVSSAGELVGVIVKTGADWSVVTTTIDVDMSAGAKISRTGQTAVIEGDWDLMREGKLKLSYLNRETDIENGDLILTSGQGGVLPSDVPVGIVTEFREESSGEGSYAVIQPKVNVDELSQVFIVKSFDIAN